MNKSLNIVSLLLKANNSLKIKAEGTSMYPIILDGDSIIIEKTEKIKIGKIYLINDNNILKIHRYVKKNTTKGDNAYELDKHLISIIGEAKYVIRGDKKIVLNKHPIIRKIIAYFSYLRGINNQSPKRKKLDKFPLNIYKIIVIKLAFIFWGK